MQEKADEPDWDRGLPLGILSAVAGGRDALKVMREVSRSWQVEFDESVKKITVGAAGPRLPATTTLAQRFPSLAFLKMARGGGRRPAWALS